MKQCKNISNADIHITGGFWKKWQATVAESSLNAVYDRFSESGRITATELHWRTGDSNPLHIFFDSDTAKWIEGAAYSFYYRKNPDIEQKIEAIIDNIERGMTDEGYFNTYYQTVEFSNRFTVRQNHELYCAGHLIEAAVAYYEATGKDRFLKLMCRYADLIERVFVTDPSAKFRTPGHEEIELALVRLYHATGEKRYLELSKHFIDERGVHEDAYFDFFNFDPRYAQDQAPVRDQQSAEGHCVRYGYLFCAAADLAKEYNDDALLAACERTALNAMTKKMYVTGGTGNMKHGEAFGPDYHLPNFEAYTETCASIAMAMLAQRILNADPDGRFGDMLELQLFNGALAGISLDGEKFYYENPLEQKPENLEFMHACGASSRPIERIKLFGCSCCPPNILRTITNIGRYYYSSDESSIFVHLYGASRAKFNLNGKTLSLTQSTRYPDNGKIRVVISAKEPVQATLAFRIPAWCDAPTVRFKGSIPDRIEKGYAYFDRKWENGDVIEIDLPMRIRMIEANPQVADDCGRVAIKRGPLVYCLEEVDNGKNLADIRIAQYPNFHSHYEKDLLGGVTVITFNGTRREWGDELYREYRPARKKEGFTAVPYYAWCNRGPGELECWVLK